MKHIYTSLDIGSDSIKVVVCELFQNKLNLLAASSYKANGIKKGLIADPDAASKSIKGAIKEVEDILGIKIDKVIASVPSYFAEYSVVKGEIDIEVEGNAVPVTRDHIREVLDKAAASKELNNHEIVTAIPVDFRLDDETGIKEPLNNMGKKLGVRAILVTTPKKNIYSVVGLLENIGITTVDISINSIGDLYAFKNKNIDKTVGAIINIGSETTTVSLYNRGIIVKSSIINMGGKHIDNDISYMYKTDAETATDLKLHFALAHKRNASTSDMHEIKTAYDDELRINQFEISEIVSSRLEEILNLVKKEINILTSKTIDYIIITGGTSNMADIEYIASDVFGKDVSIGNIKLVGIRDNKYSSCVGNIVYFINKLKLKGQSFSMISNEDASLLASIRKSYQEINNEKMLGRLMEYFLANRRI